MRRLLPIYLYGLSCAVGGYCIGANLNPWFPVAAFVAGFFVCLFIEVFND